MQQQTVKPNTIQSQNDQPKSIAILTDQELKYIEEKVDRLSLKQYGKEVTDPQHRENLKKCYRSSFYRITNIRTPYAAQCLRKYIGQLCMISGNAYFGFTFNFDDGTTVDSVHFYFKKV